MRLDPLSRSAAEQAALIREGRLSARELVDASLAAIERDATTRSCSPAPSARGRRRTRWSRATRARWPASGRDQGLLVLTEGLRDDQRQPLARRLGAGRGLGPGGAAARRGGDRRRQDEHARVGRAAGHRARALRPGAQSARSAPDHGRLLGRQRRRGRGRPGRDRARQRRRRLDPDPGLLLRRRRAQADPLPGPARAGAGRLRGLRRRRRAHPHGARHRARARPAGRRRAVDAARPAAAAALVRGRLAAAAAPAAGPPVHDRAGRGGGRARVRRRRPPRRRAARGARARGRRVGARLAGPGVRGPLGGRRRRDVPRADGALRRALRRTAGSARMEPATRAFLETTIRPRPCTPPRRG